MKKIVALITLLVMAFCLSACNKDPLVINESDTFVVVKVETDKTDLTLSQYMQSLTEYNENFEIVDGMVVSINGIKNASDWSSCWMLYTSDVDNANTGWGKIEYKGSVYGSAILGAESLIVKDGCLYIWVYQSVKL